MTTTEREDVRLLKPKDEVWSDVMKILSRKLKEPTIRASLRPVRLESIDGRTASLVVANDFSRTMISNQMSLLVEAFQEVTGEELDINITIDPSVLSGGYISSIASIAVTAAPSQSQSREPLSQPQQGATERANLNSKHTFASFVVGSHNRFCHSAAMAVAQKPGDTYNPLFIYGGVGLGKTHLMQAIGTEILSMWPNKTVRYITCERFMNELINAIQHGRQAEFRKRYRQVDVLLMDDIQFLSGKEQTQEEFFHTFNALKDSEKQIVLSSDRPPKAIATLEERLRSRFEWGLTADIQPPDLETRVAILRRKSQAENMSVSDELIDQIATMFTSNIRQLEGALIRVHAYSNLTGTVLDRSSLIRLLKPEEVDKPQKMLTIDDVIDSVAQHYRIESSEIRSAKRSQDLTLPRHIAMYLAHEVLEMSFPKIGQIFANRKHSSVIYACDRIKDEIAQDQELVATLRKIRQQLGV